MAPHESYGSVKALVLGTFLCWGYATAGKAIPFSADGGYSLFYSTSTFTGVASSDIQHSANSGAVLPFEHILFTFFQNDNTSGTGFQSYSIWFIGGISLIALLAIIWAIMATYQARTKTRQLHDELNQKNLLLREVHHRIKNNLAIISGLIDLQADSMEDPAARKLLEDTRVRIQAMAMVHNKLHESVSLKSIDMSNYVEEIAKGVHSTFANNNRSVDLKLDVDEIDLQMDRAIPCGLLVSELMVNAYKHAFDKGDNGMIRVRMFEEEQLVHLVIEDNGVGLPGDFDIKSTDSLGVMLIDTFTQQLQAKVNIESNGYSRFTFRFPAYEN